MLLVFFVAAVAVHLTFRLVLLPVPPAHSEDAFAPEDTLLNPHPSPVSVMQSLFRPPTEKEATNSFPRQFGGKPILAGYTQEAMCCCRCHRLGLASFSR